MKKLNLQHDIGSLFRKIPGRKTLEVFLLSAFIVVAGFSFWLWYDIARKTSDENVPESSLISDDKMDQLKKVKSDFDAKTEKIIEEEGTMPRNSFH